MKDKRAYWMKHYQDYQSSGLSASKWCKKNGIPANTLWYWIKKFNKEKEEQELNQTKWVSVVPTPSKISLTGSKPIKVTIGHAIIEVIPGFDPTTFETITRILRDQC